MLGYMSPCNVLYIIMVALRIKFEVELINILFLKRVGLEMLCVCVCGKEQIHHRDAAVN